MDSIGAIVASDENQLRGGGTGPESISSLSTLVTAGRKFRTIYADPPWTYNKTVGRGAARRHYRTMSLAEICAEPVSELAADNAHLHLWSTSSLIAEALQVIEAWGFRYTSSFIWNKPQLGTGNYWRLSHELMLLGVRGKFPFADRCQRSWIVANRTEHSRKPGIVRCLVEKVSAPPYLELYGREEVHSPDWTVYGNQIERRLF